LRLAGLRAVADGMELFHLKRSPASAAAGRNRPFPAVFGVLTGLSAIGG
jgi:hypothetical protein